MDTFQLYRGKSMNSVPPLPVHEERGLILRDEEDRSTLVISDVHVGFELQLINEGTYIPNQLPGVIKRIQIIAKNENIERFVINGDLKHKVPTVKWKTRKDDLDELDRSGEDAESEFDEHVKQLTLKMKDADPDERKELQKEFERLENKKSTYYRKRRNKRYSILEKSEIELKQVSQFLRILLELGQVDVIPGNHDGRIEKEMESAFPTLISDPDLVFRPSTGMIIGNAGIFHGHSWPSVEVMAQKYLIMGHGHAAILLTDDLGVRNYEQCWLRARLTEKVHEKYFDANGEVILMPSFNDFFRGSPVNRKGRLLGPLFKNDFVDVDNGSVFLLDGVDIGKVKNLRRFAQSRGKRW
jgi:metallophosphoesterase superfamily enzyme